MADTHEYDEPLARLDALLEEYWSTAYKEGQEGRDHDNEAGDAQRTLSALTDLFRSLQGRLEAERKARKEAERVAAIRLDTALTLQILADRAESRLAAVFEAGNAMEHAMDYGDENDCIATGNKWRAIRALTPPEGLKESAGICPGCGMPNDHDMYKCVQDHIEDVRAMVNQSAQEPVTAGSGTPPFTSSPVADPIPGLEQTCGVDLIAAERKRQIEQEGWTAEHDAEHDAGSMAVAGACYALYAASVLTAQEWWGQQFQTQAERLWQWDKDWWKPKEPLRDLIRAGALIAAEIDRLREGK